MEPNIGDVIEAADAYDDVMLDPNSTPAQKAQAAADLLGKTLSFTWKDLQGVNPALGTALESVVAAFTAMGSPIVIAPNLAN